MGTTEKTGNAPLPLAEQRRRRLPASAALGWLSAGWRDMLDERIRSLVQLRDQLEGCIGCGCLSMEDCPLRNPGDRLGEFGDGAVLLEKDARARGSSGDAG